MNQLQRDYIDKVRAATKRVEHLLNQRGESKRDSDLDPADLIRIAISLELSYEERLANGLRRRVFHGGDDFDSALP